MRNNRNYQKISYVKQSVITALCAALCVVFPIAFHVIPQGGIIFCPMHIPVLLCGLICGWQYAMICGIIGPLLSSVITGMPLFAILPSMMLELVVYGTACSLLMRFIHTGKTLPDIYISLVSSLLIGRVIGGIAKALVFTRGEITIVSWATAYFVTCFPAIIMQLILVPLAYFALIRAKLIPKRY